MDTPIHTHVDPEDACMDQAGTGNACCERATRFHERTGESTDEILCDAHAAGKLTVPLTTGAMHKLRTILGLWDTADLDANVAYYGGPKFKAGAEVESRRLLSTLSYTERARRDLLRMYALSLTDGDAADAGLRRRLDDLLTERHTTRAMALWIARIVEDTLMRLDGQKPLRAPVPGCADIITTEATAPTFTDDVTAWFTAAGTKTTKTTTTEET